MDGFLPITLLIVVIQFAFGLTVSLIRLSRLELSVFTYQRCIRDPYRDEEPFTDSEQERDPRPASDEGDQSPTVASSLVGLFGRFLLLLISPLLVGVLGGDFIVVAVERLMLAHRIVVRAMRISGIRNTCFRSVPATLVHTLDMWWRPRVAGHG